MYTGPTIIPKLRKMMMDVEGERNLHPNQDVSLDPLKSMSSAFYYSFL